MLLGFNGGFVPFLWWEFFYSLISTINCHYEISILMVSCQYGDINTAYAGHTGSYFIVSYRDFDAFSSCLLFFKAIVSSDCWFVVDDLSQLC